jgi:hypothetical protein
MKAAGLNTLNKNFFPGIFTIMVAFLFNSCVTNVSFMTSYVAPAARGDVTIKTDKNKNYIIDIKVRNLAEVERLQSSKQTYVVWLVTDQEISKNIGKLKSSGGVISRQLKASLKTVSSSKPIKIFITAETDPNVQNPDSKVILSTDRFQM